ALNDRARDYFLLRVYSNSEGRVETESQIHLCPGGKGGGGFYRAFDIKAYFARGAACFSNPNRIVSAGGVADQCFSQLFRLGCAVASVQLGSDVTGGARGFSYRALAGVAPRHSVGHCRVDS